MSEPGAETDHDVVVERPAGTTAEPATLVGTFIDTEGEHAVDGAGVVEIHVVRDGGLLNYRVLIRTAAAGPGTSGEWAASTDERVTTTGPKHAAIDPSSNWFIHVESDRRYWVFDGTPRSSEVKMTDLESAPDRLLAEMPDSVKDRIPAHALTEMK